MFSIQSHIQSSLDLFVSEAKAKLGDDLISIVLFGSAAEGKLRPTSDVNLMLVLKDYKIERINPLREQYRMAHAAIQLSVMFLLEDEIEMAGDAFAVKFADILHRHQILHGKNPFAALQISRASQIHRLKQVLLNQTLRLRERYALVSLREEQMIQVIADGAGPLRASAATLLNLKGQNFTSPKDALSQIAKGLQQTEYNDLLARLSQAREERNLPVGAASKTVEQMLHLLKQMYQLALQL